MKTNTLAPMTLSDETLTAVAGGKKHGRRFPGLRRAPVYAPTFVKNIDLDIDVTVLASGGSAVSVDIDVDL